MKISRELVIKQVQSEMKDKAWNAIVDQFSATVYNNKVLGHITSPVREQTWTLIWPLVYDQLYQDTKRIPLGNPS